MTNVDVAVLGANKGFVGGATAEILGNHPNVASVQTPPSENLAEFEGSDVVFSALPHGISGQQTERFLSLGSTVVDFSGDFRFQTAAEYERWYDRPHPAPKILPAVYGLPEYSRGQLAGQSLAAVPGCYPTGSLLSLIPLVEGGLIRTDSMVVINADSAVSGAGHEPSELTHFMNISGNVIPYKTGDVHRHVGEIEQFLNGRSVFFSPVILPLERGMLVRINAVLKDGATADDAREALKTAYENEPFVHVLEEEKLPEVKDTAGTDECHIGVVGVGQMIQLGSSLDNLRKGGSSEGVHVFNIMMGYPETAGLTPKASMRP